MIALYDCSVGSTNLGDSIIMESVQQVVDGMFPSEFQVRLSSHDYASRTSLSVLKRSLYTFVGGSNLLSSRSCGYHQWAMSPADVAIIHDAVLLGVGWWQYQKPPDRIMAWLLHRVLSRTKLHSVRDEYARRQLAAIGIKNVVVTACPTTWKLTPEHCAAIPQAKAESVVVTLTDYRQDPVADKRCLALLRTNYAKVLFWPQGSRDTEYFQKLAVPDIQVLNCRLRDFDDVLVPNRVDYVGTRLHGGIRALQRGVRTIIIEVDNRAHELGKTIALPTVRRGDYECLESKIQSQWQTSILLPVEGIRMWRGQFGTTGAESEDENYQAVPDDVLDVRT